MVKGDAKKVARRGAAAPLTRAYFDEVMAKVFGRFEQVDQRFEQVDKRLEQVDRRFEQVDRRFEQVETKLGEFGTTLERFGTRLDDEVRGFRVTVEKIEREVRVIAEGHAGEVDVRSQKIQDLRDELLPRIETVEGVVREHSAQLKEKADKSLEQRVEALEAAAKR